MCSITALLDLEGKGSGGEIRGVALEISKRQRHRGPDWSGVFQHENAVLVHERLAIVDVSSGAQPLIDGETGSALAVNGEIYNHKSLRESTKSGGYPYRTGSDCEVILALYRDMGRDLVNELEGMYAFVLYDPKSDFWLIARDPIGIIPLFYGHNKEGKLLVASEMKALSDICDDVSEFPPGCTFAKGDDEPVRYFKEDWMEYDDLPMVEYKPEEMKAQLEKAVKSHLMGDVPYGLLISGGLDSSVIAAIAKKYSSKRVDDDGASDAWWPSIHSFSIGLEDSPDLAAAQKVADAIDTVHHSLVFTIQEGLDALDEVVRHIETYDVTTIRASTPMYLMARQIKAMGIKMVLSGEGADELLGGYLYFHLAPNPKEFHEETVRKVLALSKYDCSRANKSMMAWGIEARVPFLDKPFVDYAMRLDPKVKMGGEGRIEKHILRESFIGSLPEEILWRQKEQFSDGVGYGWIDGLKDYAEKMVTNSELERANVRFPINTPDSKEGYFYRTIFEKHYPSAACAAIIPGGKTVACSTEKALEWSESLRNLNDPSGRAVKSVHKDGY
ncbi:MAG: asparagine synthase B [Bacteroidetes bacterium]|nr:MAG: asparagine synthase B [Bacteroidota bacterium]